MHSTHATGIDADLIVIPLQNVEKLVAAVVYVL